MKDQLGSIVNEILSDVPKEVGLKLPTLKKSSNVNTSKNEITKTKKRLVWQK